jgi:hypothetical protein
MKSGGQVHYLPDGFFSHYFAAVRPGIQMTVFAGLVAEQADIDLQGGAPVTF